MPNLQSANQKSGFLAFFSELWERLTSGTPIFFRIIRNIAAIVAILAGVAKILQESGTDFPDAIDNYISWALIAGAVAAAIVAQLPTTDKDRKVQDGELPFTAKRISEGKEPIH